MTIQTAAAAMTRVLEDLDVAGARRLWGFLAEADSLKRVSDADIIKTMHIARTGANAVDFDKRAYSHRWLSERGLPSHLPDSLKPKAERLYPKAVPSVGLAVKMRNSEVAGAGLLIRREMENAVMEAEADGRLTDDEHVRARVQEARFKERRKLLGY